MPSVGIRASFTLILSLAPCSIAPSADKPPSVMVVLDDGAALPGVGFVAGAGVPGSEAVGAGAEGGEAGVATGGLARRSMFADTSTCEVPSSSLTSYPVPPTRVTTPGTKLDQSSRLATSTRWPT